jgi:hypothetical protein
MKKPVLSIAAISIAGSFAIHCTQSALPSMDGSGDGEFMDDAKADGPAPRTFTKLAEFDLWYDDSGSHPSEVFAVGAYRELVLYRTSGGCAAYPVFRPDAETEFGHTNQWGPGLIRIDGPEVRFHPGNDSCREADHWPRSHFVLAGMN